MNVRENSRQIPKTKEICANKLYYDVLYAYLQTISLRQEGMRVFYKKDLNFSKLANKLGLSRQTLSKKFKNLQDGEFKLVEVLNEEKTRFRLNELPKDKASLIEYRLLKLLTDALTENAISTYVYLLNRYYANNCQPFLFKLSDIKSMIGLSETSRNNNDVITNILFVLQKIGLIKYSMTAVSQNDNFQNIKTIYRLDSLTNDYDELVGC